MESVREDDDLNYPSWVNPVFEKLKAEICAEVHAKVSYTIRIMLDQMSENIKQSLENPKVDNRNKCRNCRKSIKKEEKKQNKLAYLDIIEKKNPRFSYLSSDIKSSDDETESEIIKKQVKSMKQVPIISLGALKQKSFMKEAHSLEMQLPKKFVYPFKVPEAKNLSPTSLRVSGGESNPCCSDSEFEVVSLPPTPLDVVDNCINCDMAIDSMLSDSEDSELETERQLNLLKKFNELDDVNEEPKQDLEDVNEESESQLHFTDCQSISESEMKAIGDNELEEDKLKSFSTMSESSTFMEDRISLQSSTGFQLIETLDAATETFDVGTETFDVATETFDVATKTLDSTTETLDAAVETEALLVTERERAPYSATYEDKTQASEAETVVTNQPLPLEFDRQRKPYNGIPANNPEQQSNYHVQGSIPAAGATSVPTPASVPRRRRSGGHHYQVDNLPESLWDEALTVAAQTYNAAKVAVENLADTFVPGSSPPVSSNNAGPTTKAPSGQRRIDPRMVVTDEEQLLIEMGFTNAAHNAVLLDRHNHDMAKVVAALIEL